MTIAGKTCVKGTGEANVRPTSSIVTATSQRAVSNTAGTARTDQPLNPGKPRDDGGDDALQPRDSDLAARHRPRQRSGFMAEHELDRGPRDQEADDG